MDLFDILGPVMVGPSSSHTAGAVRIGLMARTLLGAPPVEAAIHLHGSFAETGPGHGTDRALVAWLLGMQPDDLRIPRAAREAEKAGLTVTIDTVDLREAHPNTAVLSLRAANGKRLEMQACSLGGGRIMVNKLDGIEVSFTGAFNTLVVRGRDVNGVVSGVTSILYQVAGLVEVPCVKRNVIGAVNAVSSADMALAGIESRIPVDEVIDAMGEVGRRMPVEFRETALGGLAATPTGQAVKARMQRQ